MSTPVRSHDGPDLDSYDNVIIAFSGGKDASACVLHLLDHGIQPELWHHDVDGDGGDHFMDWPVTQDYCRRFAEAFGLKIYFSWREGGFLREMLRWDTPTGRIIYETPDGMAATGGHSRPGRRRKFPQVSADLSVRWCSSYLKIDVMAAALRGQQRFTGKRVLIVTGERAEESSGRARYATFEPHRTHGRRRHVDVWRPVHAWDEAAVWRILERYRVNPHPGYQLGWPRLSCRHCIFGTPNQCASARAIDPVGFARLPRYEKEFGVSVHQGETLVQRADRGRPFNMDPDVVKQAMSVIYEAPIFIDSWKLPAGAFAKGGGPP